MAPRLRCRDRVLTDRPKISVLSAVDRTGVCVVAAAPKSASNQAREQCTAALDLSQHHLLSRKQRARSCLEMRTKALLVRRLILSIITCLLEPRISLVHRQPLTAFAAARRNLGQAVVKVCIPPPSSGTTPVPTQLFVQADTCCVATSCLVRKALVMRAGLLDDLICERIPKNGNGCRGRNDCQRHGSVADGHLSSISRR